MYQKSGSIMKVSPFFHPHFSCDLTKVFVFSHSEVALKTGQLMKFMCIAHQIIPRMEVYLHEPGEGGSLE